MVDGKKEGIKLVKKQFDPKVESENVIEWIRNWFEKNGKGCNAIIGMSGGKDSTIVAKLLVEALGKERVIGVGMPDGNQSLNEADKICEWLGIKFKTVNIGPVCDAERKAVIASGTALTSQAEQNIPPRVRMITLYAEAQSLNGMPINTCNLSENWIGYSTIYGDAAGAMSPCHNLTVTEILQIGDYLGIPYEWVHKTPDDGLPHSSPDEEKLGFTYADLDKWIRKGQYVEGFCHDNSNEERRQDKIDRMHRNNLFKTKYMDCYDPEL